LQLRTSNYFLRAAAASSDGNTADIQELLLMAGPDAGALMPTGEVLYSSLFSG
jgi:hypothetical protein